MIELYVGATVCAGVLDGRFAQSALPSWGSNLEAVLGELLVGRARWRWATARVWLSGGLVEATMIEQVEGLTSWSEVEALALARLPGADRGHALRVALDGFPGEANSLAIAADDEMLIALQACAARFRTKLASIQPWWAAELPPGTKAGDNREILVATDDEAATVIVGDPSWHVAVARFAPCPAAPQLHATVQRLALVHQVDEGSVREVRGGVEWLRRLSPARLTRKGGAT